MLCKHNRLTRIVQPPAPDTWKCSECGLDFEISPRKITVESTQSASRPIHPNFGPEDGPPGQNEQ